MAAGDKIMGNREILAIGASLWAQGSNEYNRYCVAPVIIVETDSTNRERQIRVYRRSGSSWIQIQAWNTENGAYFYTYKTAPNQEPLFRVRVMSTSSFFFGQPSLTLGRRTGYGLPGQKVYYYSNSNWSETVNASNYKANKGALILGGIFYENNCTH